MMHVKLFGSTAVVIEDGAVAVTDLGGVKPRQILEILALSAGSPVPKDRLGGAVGGGRAPKPGGGPVGGRGGGVGRRGRIGARWRGTCVCCVVGSGRVGVGVRRWRPRLTGTCWTRRWSV